MSIDMANMDNINSNVEKINVFQDILVKNLNNILTEEKSEDSTQTI